MKIWYKKLKYKFIRHLIAALTSKTSDAAIAFGFAVGTFIALLPTPGLNWVLAFVAALIYKKLNKLSLFFAVVFWNPLFVAPVYALCYVAGDFLFEVLPLQAWISFIDHPYVSHSGKFLTGNLLLTSLISIGAYYTALNVVALYKKKRARRQEARKQHTNKITAY